MKYYYCPPTCSLAGMAALEISGAPYEAVEIDPRGDRALLLAANPDGKVPVLDADGTIVTDTVAIIYWLARRFPHAGLLPSDPTLTALALSKMAWFGNVFQIVRRRVVRPQMYSPDAAAQQSIKIAAERDYASCLEKVDGWLTDPYCPLAVRVYALLFYHWGVIDGQPVHKLDQYTVTASLLSERQDVRRALERHNSPLLKNLA